MNAEAVVALRMVCKINGGLRSTELGAMISPCDEIPLPGQQHQEQLWK